MKKKIFMAVIAFAMILCTSIAFVGCNSNGDQTPPTIPSTAAGYMVIGSSSEGGKVYGSCNAVENSNVTLFAVPDEGYRFDKWSDGNTNPERKFNNVNEDISLTAYFKPVLRFVKAQIGVASKQSIPSDSFWKFEDFEIKYNDKTIAEDESNGSSFYSHEGVAIRMGGVGGMPVIYANDNYEFDKDSTITLEVDFDLRLCNRTDFDLIEGCFGPVSIELPVKNSYESIRTGEGNVYFYECKIPSTDEMYDVHLKIYFE